MYKQQDMAVAMAQVYGKTPEELNQAFVDYVRLFRTDEALEPRMEILLSQ